MELLTPPPRTLAFSFSSPTSASPGLASPTQRLLTGQSTRPLPSLKGLIEQKSAELQAASDARLSALTGRLAASEALVKELQVGAEKQAALVAQLLAEGKTQLKLIDERDAALARAAAAAQHGQAERQSREAAAASVLATAQSERRALEARFEAEKAAVRDEKERSLATLRDEKERSLAALREELTATCERACSQLRLAEAAASDRAAKAAAAAAEALAQREAMASDVVVSLHAAEEQMETERTAFAIQLDAAQAELAKTARALSVAQTEARVSAGAAAAAVSDAELLRAKLAACESALAAHVRRGAVSRTAFVDEADSLALPRVRVAPAFSDEGAPASPLRAGRPSLARLQADTEALAALAAAPTLPLSPYSQAANAVRSFRHLGGADAAASAVAAAAVATGAASPSAWTGAGVAYLPGPQPPAASALPRPHSPTPRAHSPPPPAAPAARLELGWSTLPQGPPPAAIKDAVTRAHSPPPRAPPPPPPPAPEPTQRRRTAAELAAMLAELDAAFDADVAAAAGSSQPRVTFQEDTHAPAALPSRTREKVAAARAAVFNVGPPPPGVRARASDAGRAAAPAAGTRAAEARAAVQRAVADLARLGQRY